MATYDDVSNQNITVIGLCGAVGTFVIIIGLQAMYHNFELREFERKVVKAPTIGPESFLSDQRNRLNTYGWVDREKQIVAIPIEEAMALTVNRESQKQKRGSDHDHQSSQSF
jgi:hypothetical protein